MERRVGWAVAVHTHQRTDPQADQPRSGARHQHVAHGRPPAGEQRHRHQGQDHTDRADPPDRRHQPAHPVGRRREHREDGVLGVGIGPDDHQAEQEDHDRDDDPDDVRAPASRLAVTDRGQHDGPPRTVPATTRSLLPHLRICRRVRRRVRRRQVRRRVHRQVHRQVHRRVHRRGGGRRDRHRAQWLLLWRHRTEDYGHPTRRWCLTGRRPPDHAARSGAAGHGPPRPGIRPRRTSGPRPPASSTRPPGCGGAGTAHRAPRARGGTAWPPDPRPRHTRPGRRSHRWATRRGDGG